MQTTTHFNFKKPELTDSPPDITVMNTNWDTLDTKLKEVEETASNITVPVTSVNSKTGAVVLAAKDIKATDGKNLETVKTETSSSLSTLNSQVSTLNTQMSSANSQISTHTTQISTLNNQSSTHTTQISSINTQISTINTQKGDLTQLKTTNKTSLVNAVNELFQSASDGKTLIADAITGRGIKTSAAATFQVMADRIGQISNVTIDGVSQTQNITLNSRGFTWSKDTMSYYVDECALVSYKGAVHVLGAISASWSSIDGTGDGVDHYKVSGNDIVSVGRLPYNASYYLNAAVLSDGIHLLGSNEDSYKQYHYVYNGSSWTKKENIPSTPYTSYATAVYNDELYMQLGFRYIYKRASDGTWTLVSDLYSDIKNDNSVYYGRPKFYKDELYVFLNTKLYKRVGTAWSLVCDLPFSCPAEYSIIEVVNNEIWFICRDSSSSSSGEESLHYTFNGTSWTRKTNIKHSIYTCQRAMHNGELYIMDMKDFWRAGQLYGGAI